MRVHSNATTNQKQRLHIQSSDRSCAFLARQLFVSKTTVRRWRGRTCATERSCQPHRISYAFSPEEETLILALREKALPLDDVVDAVRVVLPHARRASVHRLLVRHGVNRLAKKYRTDQREQQATGDTDTYGVFKQYGPGYLHIDCFYLPRLEGVRRYCFVAVDRATRLLYLGVYAHKDKEAATDFLAKCLEFFPFQVEKILTDNGREFTLEGFKNRYGPAKRAHPFEQLCQREGIQHRRTKPYTPKTNGMVERLNGLIKANTTKQHTYQSAQEMSADLQAWFERYNFYRKNRRIGGQTPYEAAVSWHHKEPGRFIKKPTDLLFYRSQSCET
jgi:transposase InsO family protein